MRLYNLLNEAKLRELIEDGYITARPSGDGQTIFNYTDKCQREGLWVKETRACRGLIVDDDSEEIIARPWEKFFNHNEPQAQLKPSDYLLPVEVTDKLDGSLGILHRARDGKPRVATRGSFHSEQAEWATNWIRERFPAIGWDYRLTPLAEIIYPENRIVVDYHGFSGLRLLGFVSIDHGTYFGPDGHWIKGCTFRLYPTGTFEYRTLKDALAAPPRKGAEGLCVRFADQPRIVKIKQADYIELHRIVSGLNERSVWQRWMDHPGPEGLDELLDGLPDELHGWVRDEWEGLEERFADIFAEVEELYQWIHRGDDRPKLRRKEFAECVMGMTELRPHLRPLLFLRYDDKQEALCASLAKSLRPQGDSYATGKSTLRHTKYTKDAA